MNMLTFSPESDPKDARRLRWQPHRQDSGTRGTARLKDYYGRPASHLREAALDRTAHEETLEHLSPKQLEKAADRILDATGFEWTDDVDDLVQDYRHVNQENGTYSLSSGEHPDPDFDDSEFYEATGAVTDNEGRTWIVSPIESSMFDNSLADEFTLAMRGAKRWHANPEVHYEGTVEDDLGEYPSGFSIKDRP